MRKIKKKPAISSTRLLFIAQYPRARESMALLARRRSSSSSKEKGSILHARRKKKKKT